MKVFDFRWGVATAAYQIEGALQKQAQCDIEKSLEQPGLKNPKTWL